MNKSNLVSKIKEVFIVRENDGSYNLFGSYVIKLKKHGMYSIRIISNPDVNNIEFSNLRYAVTYCVFKKNNKFKETERLKMLDEYIGSLDVNIAQNKKLMRNSEIPDKFIYLAKLNEYQIKKKRALKEIDVYAAISRHIQTTKYQEYLNEI